MELNCFFFVFLKVGDVAFSVPDSLVVTLKRVLGNETIGNVHCFLLLLFVDFLIMFGQTNTNWPDQ